MSGFDFLTSGAEIRILLTNFLILLHFKLKSHVSANKKPGGLSCDVKE
jgi:hypothetical protein